MRTIREFFDLGTVAGRFIGVPLLMAAIVLLLIKPWRRHSHTGTAEDLGPGIIIEEVTKNSEAVKAGLQKGDFVFRWRRGNEKGPISSPFDISSAETEQAPLGPVILEGQELGVKRAWTLAHSPWGIRCRPNLEQTLMPLYRRSEELLKQQELGEAADFSRAASKRIQRSSQGLAAWFLFHIADSFSHAHQWREADEFFTRSLQIVQINELRVHAQIQTAWAKTFERRNEWPQAEAHYQQALIEDLKFSPQNLTVAADLQNLARFNFVRGDLGRATQYAERALKIRKQLAPASLEFARTLNYLGAFAQRRGDLTKAEAYHREALAIEDRLAPSSLDVARTFNNLGAIAQQRGDLAKAEEYYLRDLNISTNLGGSPLDRSYTWNNLGMVAQSRGDLARAEDYFRRGVTIQQNVAPESLDVALAFNNLGTVLQGRGSLDRAAECFRHALSIQKKLAPKSLEYSTTLNSLGVLLRIQRRFATSEDYLVRSLSIRKTLAPESLAVAETTNDLGDVFRDRGDLSRAEVCYRSALAIRRRFAPYSDSYAESLAAIADLLRRRHELRAAAFYYRGALDTLDAQIAHLGGPREDRWRFRSQYEHYYFAYIDLLIEQHMPKLAFEALERSRARTLVEMLVQAHIDFTNGIEPALVQRKRALQRSLSALSDERIRLSTPQQASQTTVLGKRIEEILSQYQQVESEIRQESRTYGTLMQPVPLTTKEIQQHQLDGDTLLLEYLLGEDRSYIFAVSQRSLAVFKLPKRQEIDALARPVYKQLSTLRPPRNQAKNPQLIHAAVADTDSLPYSVSLSRMVLGPVAAAIKTRKRLVIVSDGILQYIPFAALPVPGVPYLGSLVREHEIVNLPSISVLAALRREEQLRTRKPEKAVAVLADPVFSADDPRVEDRSHASAYGSSNHIGTKRSIRPIGDTDLRSVNAVLPRLVSSREEAEAIMGVTPTKQSLEALDFDANRSMALSPELSHYRILHFATHGFIDNNHPELSGLVFSLVDRRGRPQIGFVGLQDIYNMNIPVNLVVLSSCSTALGAEIHGEGLIGLTRGFMYAGASRVIASLWQVDDVATAELMRRFYDSMERHRISPSAALRQAQTSMSEEKRWSDPYYWAGFTIQGEWKPPDN